MRLHYSNQALHPLPVAVLNWQLPGGLNAVLKKTSMVTAAGVAADVAAVVSALQWKRLSSSTQSAQNDR